MSDTSGHVGHPRRHRDATFAVGLPTLTRADLLALIPLAFAVAILVAALVPIAIREALAVVSTVGLGAIVDGVVRNPPVSER